MSGYLSYSIGLSLLMLIFFGILQWFHIAVGSLVDWTIGLVSFWWLLAIVIVPWNIYFEAQQTLAEGIASQDKDILVDLKQLKYVKKIARWSIGSAIILHIISAIGMYWLAATGISSVGYFSSGATILLTFLRPAVRTYEYLAYRLRVIREEISYPREDIIELRGRFTAMENVVISLEKKLDPDKEDSVVAIQERESQATRQELARLRASLEELKAKNELEHQKIAREAKSAISQLNEDSQFLDRVRDIIRFFKTA
jgi:hypothetical protein